jgi:hypothetical protein
MIKRIGVIGAALVAALAMAAIGSASASAASECLKVSEFVSGSKGGNFSDNLCSKEVKKLTGEYVLATVLSFTKEHLFCVTLLLTSTEAERETGYYKEKNCTVVLSGSSVNKSNFTEVTIPLPTILFLSGGPTVLFNTLPSKIHAQLQTTAVKAIESEGLDLELTFLNLNNMSLGEYLVFFENYKKVGGSSTEECKTSGSANGVVNLHGEIHLVYDRLASETGGLGVGTLFLVPETAIHCFEGSTETAVFDMKGSLLGLVKPILKETAANENTIEATLYCSGTTAGKTGKPLETRYWNDKGEPQEARIEVEAGKGIEKGCLLIGGSNNSGSGSIVTLLPNEMVEIDG